MNVRDGETVAQFEMTFDGRSRVEEPGAGLLVALFAVEPAPGRSRHIRCADAAEEGRAELAEFDAATRGLTLRARDAYCPRAVIQSLAVCLVRAAARSRPKRRVERQKIVANLAALVRVEIKAGRAERPR